MYFDTTLYMYLDIPLVIDGTYSKVYKLIRKYTIMHFNIFILNLLPDLIVPLISASTFRFGSFWSTAYPAGNINRVLYAKPELSIREALSNKNMVNKIHCNNSR